MNLRRCRQVELEIPQPLPRTTGLYQDSVAILASQLLENKWAVRRGGRKEWCEHQR